MKKINKLIPFLTMPMVVLTTIPLFVACKGKDNEPKIIPPTESVVNVYGIEEGKPTDTPKATIVGFEAINYDIATLNAEVIPTSGQIGKIETTIEPTGNNKFNLNLTFRDVASEFGGYSLLHIKIRQERTIIWESNSFLLNMYQYKQLNKTLNVFGGEYIGYQTSVFEFADADCPYKLQIPVDPLAKHWDATTILRLKVVNEDGDDKMRFINASDNAQIIIKEGETWRQLSKDDYEGVTELTIRAGAIDMTTLNQICIYGLKINYTDIYIHNKGTIKLAPVDPDNMVENEMLYQSQGYGIVSKHGPEQILSATIKFNDLDYWDYVNEGKNLIFTIQTPVFAWKFNKEEQVWFNNVKLVKDTDYEYVDSNPNKIIVKNAALLNYWDPVFGGNHIGFNHLQSSHEKFTQPTNLTFHARWES